MSHSNNFNHYSILTRVLHWLIAGIVVFLFALGLWMEDLDYYHAWYQKAPALHTSVGIVFIFFVVARIINRVLAQFPSALPTHSNIEKSLAKYTHWVIYVLLVVMAVSGYLLASLEGEDVSLFGLVSLPAIALSGSDVEDAIKEVHELCSFTLIGLAIAHAAAALKHHFIDKDVTLKRMTR